MLIMHCFVICDPRDPLTSSIFKKDIPEFKLTYTVKMKPCAGVTQCYVVIVCPYIFLSLVSKDYPGNTKWNHVLGWGCHGYMAWFLHFVAIVPTYKMETNDSTQSQNLLLFMHSVMYSQITQMNTLFKMSLCLDHSKQNMYRQARETAGHQCADL